MNGPHYNPNTSKQNTCDTGPTLYRCCMSLCLSEDLNIISKYMRLDKEVSFRVLICFEISSVDLMNVAVPRRPTLSWLWDNIWGVGPMFGQCKTWEFFWEITAKGYTWPFFKLSRFIYTYFCRCLLYGSYKLYCSLLWLKIWLISHCIAAFHSHMYLLYHVFYMYVFCVCHYNKIISNI